MLEVATAFPVWEWISWRRAGSETTRQRDRAIENELGTIRLRKEHGQDADESV